MGVSRSLGRLVLRYSMQIGLYTLRILDPEAKLRESKFEISNKELNTSSHFSSNTSR